MRVLSLNVNNFGSQDDNKPIFDFKRNWFEFRKQVHSWRRNATHFKNKDCVVKLIIKKKPDIVFIHEFDVTSKESVKFVKDMNSLGYKEMFPDNNMFASIRGCKSITIMFTKIDNIIVKPNKDLVDRSLRWVNAELDGILISGVHLLSNDKKRKRDVIEYWDAVERFCSENIDKDFILIGDLNVFIKGTYTRKRFDRVLNLCDDLWLYKGNPNNTPTFYEGSRLDYALVSKSMLKRNLNININTSPIKYNYSDHNALIVDID